MHLLLLPWNLKEKVRISRTKSRYVDALTLLTHIVLSVESIFKTSEHPHFMKCPLITISEHPHSMRCPLITISEHPHFMRRPLITISEHPHSMRCPLIKNFEHPHLAWCHQIVTLDYLRTLILVKSTVHIIFYQCVSKEFVGINVLRELAWKVIKALSLAFFLFRHGNGFFLIQFWFSKWRSSLRSSFIFKLDISCKLFA